ncbi:MAG: LPS export ABC transporter permease LptF, partial [Hyphomicrobiales bacterium]
MAFGLTTKIEQYVFRKGLSAFLLTTIVLTIIIWITQALRKIDLVSSKGQTLELYLIVSSLAVPSLVVVLAPVALLIAVIYVINSLHQDSEIIVIASAGGSPKRVTRPLLWLSLLVAILTGVLSISVAPKGLSQLRGYITQIRADLIASIMVPGGFTDVDKGIMVHIKERNIDGSLSGILISDTRNPDVSFQYLASRGAIVEAGVGTYLIMQNGNIVRREKSAKAASIIEFDSYAFDLSQFRERTTKVKFKAKETLTADLLSMKIDDVDARNFQKLLGELHGRFVAPLYAFTFATIAMLFMASPQSTRTGRSFAVLAAVVGSVVVRGLGFAAEG